MVKSLRKYEGKICYIHYGNQGFDAEIIVRRDEKGNYRYFIKTPKGEEVRVYSRGKNKAKMNFGNLEVAVVEAS